MKVAFTDIQSETKSSIEEPKSRKYKVYSRKDVEEKCRAYFNGDDLAARVWIDKYALKDEKGRIHESSPEQMHQRLAYEIARIEKKYPHPMKYGEVFELLDKFKYLIPQGGVMAGVGNDFQYTSLSNCFVIGPRGNADSYGAILQVDEEQVQLMKRRGGVGHDLSGVRPKGNIVRNCALTSAGIVPFMKRFSNSTEEVAQDGRRGALMLSLDVRHPEIENFIDAKLDSGEITNANISVRISDEFMRSVESDQPFELRFPLDSLNPTNSVSINARGLWNKIVHNAWKSAEPGILFWDTIIRESIPDSYEEHGFRTVSTNPCGEVPLCPYDSCRLLAINLFSYVNDPFQDDSEFDFQLFEEHAQKAQRIMDDIVDLEIERIDGILGKIISDPQDFETKRTELELWKKVREKCVLGRRVGIGVTAEGDMLAALGLRYGSQAAIDHSVEVHKRLALSAYRSSVDLARERGAFEIYNYENEAANPFVNRIKETDPDLYSDMTKYGRRNISLLTIAPTGTTSLMTQTSSGIEPVFRVAYTRRRKKVLGSNNGYPKNAQGTSDQWEEHKVFHHKFLKCLEGQGYNQSELSKLSDEELVPFIERTPYYQSEAKDIDWINKVKMQGAIQKWVDHSISVTVNVPKETDEAMIGNIYMTAWKSGCKGITVYREGSRDGILISQSKNNEEDSDKGNGQKDYKRPQKLKARVFRFQNHDEKWIAAVGLLNDRPYEIFTGCAEDSFHIPTSIEEGWIIKNRNGEGNSRYDFQYVDQAGYKVTYEGLSRCFNEEFWNLAKMISGVLRHGMPLISVVKVVSNLHLDDTSLNTWKNGVTRALSNFIENGSVRQDLDCPDCGEHHLVFEEGCLKCPDCGYTKCE